MNNIEISEASYPDFVAMIGQNNCPPGAEMSLELWMMHASITSKSILLDLACSTGYSSRRLAQLSGCRAVGIDTSLIATKIAGEMANRWAVADLVKYQTGNACDMLFAAGSFDVITAGSCFGFIKDRQLALGECVRVLKKGGNLCISTFFYHSTPPQGVIERVQEAAGFRPDINWDLDYWRKFFATHLHCKFEQIVLIEPMPESTIVLDALNFVVHESDTLRKEDVEIKEQAFRRLVRDRLIFNEHRKYQSLAVQVWSL